MYEIKEIVTMLKVSIILKFNIKFYKISSYMRVKRES